MQKREMFMIYCSIPLDAYSWNNTVVKSGWTKSIILMVGDKDGSLNGIGLGDNL